jgi:thiosulfate/3-mercaptopyruvate sulfurtransferase
MVDSIRELGVDVGLLVSSDWLAEHLDAPNLRIVDIRGHVLPANVPPPHYFNHYDDYLKLHIPGAVFVDWVNEITDPDDPRHAQIGKPERFAEVMSRIGVDENTLVVAYDDARGMFAARLWWALNYYGHTKVAVLNGGWEKWIAEYRPLSTEIPVITPKTFMPKTTDELRRTGDQVLAALSSEQQLIDVRTLEEFRGDYARASRKGHIPGAVNLPRLDLTNADSTMLDPQALREKFATVGVSENSQNVVFYCNGGVSASYGYLALRAAGLINGSVYDGSWKDWGNDESKPIE